MSARSPATSVLLYFLPKWQHFANGLPVDSHRFPILTSAILANMLQA
jgi:hypothetical protein